MNRSNLVVSSVALLLVSVGMASGETITLRSGQSSGVPGTAGQFDDTVRYYPVTVAGGPLSAFPFSGGHFSGANSGPSAVVINPHPLWTPGISDPAARWIDFALLPGTSMGDAGSCLYAVPFIVTTPGATNALINIEYSVDDGAGDFVYGGSNPSFLYVNGIDMGAASTANFLGSSFHSQTIPVSTGLNTIYLYQRDQGFGVSGIIFSMTLTVPTPGAAVLLGAGGLFAARRRRVG